MEGTLFNLGIKVKDVDAELRFYESVGATLLGKQPRSREGRDYEVAIVVWLGTRILLTPMPMFERPEAPRALGLAHAVWEVTDFDGDCDRLAAAGAREVRPRSFFDAPEGRRRAAFFESPNGLDFEILEILPK